jgi:hypothetical protein
MLSPCWRCGVDPKVLKSDAELRDLGPKREPGWETATREPPAILRFSPPNPACRLGAKYRMPLEQAFVTAP